MFKWTYTSLTRYCITILLFQKLRLYQIEAILQRVLQESYGSTKTITQSSSEPKGDANSTINMLLESEKSVDISQQCHNVSTYTQLKLHLICKISSAAKYSQCGRTRDKCVFTGTKKILLSRIHSSIVPKQKLSNLLWKLPHYIYSKFKLNPPSHH